MKAAGVSAAVEWHQDWAFYPHTNADLLAVGIMLDDINDINRQMQVQRSRIFFTKPVPS